MGDSIESALLRDLLRAPDGEAGLGPRDRSVAAAVAFTEAIRRLEAAGYLTIRSAIRSLPDGGPDGREVFYAVVARITHRGRRVLEQYDRAP